MIFAKRPELPISPGTEERMPEANAIKIGMTSVMVFTLPVKSPGMPLARGPEGRAWKRWNR